MCLLHPSYKRTPFPWTFLFERLKSALLALYALLNFILAYALYPPKYLSAPHPFTLAQIDQKFNHEPLAFLFERLTLSFFL